MAGTLMFALLLRRGALGSIRGRRDCDPRVRARATGATRRTLGERPDSFFQHRTCPACSTRETPVPLKANPLISPYPVHRKTGSTARRWKPEPEEKGKVPRQKLHRYGVARSRNPMRNKNSRMEGCICKATRHYSVAAAEPHGPSCSVLEHLSHRLQECGEPKRLFDDG